MKRNVRWDDSSEITCYHSNEFYLPIYLSVCLSIWLSAYLTIYLSMALQPFVRPWMLLSILILYKVGWTPWMGNQPVARPLPTHRKPQIQNKRTMTSKTRVRFEPTILAFAEKTVHALDHAITVIGRRHAGVIKRLLQKTKHFTLWNHWFAEREALGSESVTV
jgi:hypothetical protein